MPSTEPEPADTQESPVAKAVQSQLGELKLLNPERKKFILIVLLVLFVASLMMASKIQKKQEESPVQTDQTATVTAPAEAPKTSLSLSPASAELTVGQTQEITVSLTDVPVTAIDVVLTYDPTTFSVSNVTNGDIFGRVIRNTVEDGKVIFSASVLPEKKDALSEGDVLTFTVKALNSSGSAFIAFDPTETITALGGENTLGVTTGATFTID